ncbi:MAG: hypothetical protein EA381_14065 [Planctomycetaceae bacterium]|nr:MAG: hypothetical protein EA381_14065 [Planctomycetaceae bacterium]
MRTSFSTYRPRSLWLPVCLALVGLTADLHPAAAQESAQAGLKWVETPESLVLYETDTPGLGDNFVFQYLFRSGKKPIIYPLIGPSGQTISRHYPMKPAGEGETTDHIHQRSMWWTHGEVNDVDFWAEGAGSGEIRHQAVTETKVEKGVGSFSATAEWVTPAGEVLLKERKTISVRSAEAGRMIDFEIELTAVADEVHFGDTKEGSFGIRVADSMMVDRKLGGKILNDSGQTDKDAWGVRARWVDYSGPVNGETVGVTILEHPTSFGHPCRWHVRSYGLFAANPFGEFHFVGGDKTDGFRLPKGESITMKYRVVLHDGYGDKDAIEGLWKAFSGKQS